MWWKVIGGLVTLWLVVAVAGAVIGVVIDGLFWLAVIAGGLFIGTAVLGRGKKKQIK